MIVWIHAKLDIMFSIMFIVVCGANSRFSAANALKVSVAS